MGFFKKLFKKIKDLLKNGGRAASSPPIPSAAAPAGMGDLPARVLRALERSFEDRTQSEIDSNRVSKTPLPSRVFCDTLAQEYDSWFRTLHAGIMSPNPTGLAALKSGLRTFMFSSWGVSFAAYWTSTTWLPTGVYTGGIVTNGTVQGAGLQSELTSMLTRTDALSDKNSMREFANRMAGILYTYTTGLIVQATLSVPPNTKTEKVM